MSWQTYVDTNLVGTGKVSKAAILGQQGGVWAASPKYQLSPEEQNAIIAAFSNSDKALAEGLRLSGVKFVVLGADDERINLKKGVDGATIAKTKQAVLVGEYNNPVQSQENAKVVEDLADYLKNAGY